MDLTVLLEPKVNLSRVARVLDDLGPSGRLDTIRGWEVHQQAALYEAAKGFKAIGLEDFVPSSIGAMTEVVHHGKRSAFAFNHFEKRFCRPGHSPSESPAPSEEVWGYTRQDFLLWTGPGYFVAYPAETAGEVTLDHTRLPLDKPEGWPEILPSSARLGRYVYEGHVDVMRGISRHVTLGRTRRGTEWMNAWFVLCREDLS
jgi:hypothetical protein